MKILLCSYWFHPSFGGVETFSKILAEEWSAFGHEVTVVTNTPGEPLAAAYKIVRKPGTAELLALGRASDIIVQNIISLRTLITLLMCFKPVVVIHSSWLHRVDRKSRWQEHTKLFFTKFVHNVSISRSIADSLPVPSIVIGNPFATEEFAGLRNVPKTKDLVFMGRLVSDKGVDTLLEALGKLRARGLTPSLTVIGDGPEMSKLREMTQTLQLTSQIAFLGALREERGKVVAEHRIMVVPSRWAEPFGIVALEGIASGCTLIASMNGGLPDAVGLCGVLFPNGDSSALAVQIERVLMDPVLERKLMDAGPSHLKHFEAASVASRYLELFTAITISEGNRSRA